MGLDFLLYIAILWIAGILIIVIPRSSLLRSIWEEPYISTPVVIIESDDWGPGPISHQAALSDLIHVLENHRDSVGRPVVLTANMVLTIPNARVIKESKFTQYERIPLDKASPEIMTVLKKFIAEGKIVPQLHGLEHYNLNTLMEHAKKGDKRIQSILTEEGWTSWDTLEPHLQRHYHDRNGSAPEGSVEDHNELVTESTMLFRRLFHHDSLSTIAPCSVWNDETEKAWFDNGIRFIQTEGYRLIGSYSDAKVRKSPRIIRFGTKNDYDQTYLVRNVMYEPAIGRNAESCWGEIVSAFRQGLPAIISTHRFNFTDIQKSKKALKDLDSLLTRIDLTYPLRRYLSSPELGESLEKSSVYNRFIENGRSQWPELHMRSFPEKLEGFFFRLWYRHRKFRFVTICSGLLLPLFVILGMNRLFGKLHQSHPEIA
jgi:hypothetical protein